MVFPQKKSRKRIPKEYLAPRPMVAGALAKENVWSRLPWPVVAMLISVAVVLALPLHQAEGVVRALQLEFAGESEPPRSALAVEVDPDQCSSELSDLVRASNPRLVVLVSPLAELCPRLTTPEDAVVSRAHFLQGGDRLIGILPQSPLAPSVGSGFVAPREHQAIPVLAADDLLSRRVSSELLYDKIIVLGARLPAVRSDLVAVTSVISAGLEDGYRHRLPPVAATLLLVLLAGLGAYAPQLAELVPGLRTSSVGTTSLFFTVCSLVALVSLSGALGFGYLLPVCQCLLVLGFSGVAAVAPELRARRISRDQAERLLKQGLDHRTFGLADEDDAAFFNRLADRAAQAHPADSILVAELPPFRWHLKVWPHRDVDESIIKERRRDIRRSPYSDERGVPVTAVTRGYLVMKDWPAVLVPLMADGDVEGYLILVGPPAERAFREAPERTERLGQELAALIRHRRLLRTRAPGTVGMDDPRQVVDAARGMLEELSLMGTLFRNAPVGLLYADSFGDVRLIGSALRDQLRALGIEVPVGSEGGILAPAELPLSRVLEAFDQNKTLADIGASDLLLSNEDTGVVLTLTVRQLSGDGGVASGYVAAAQSQQPDASAGGAGDLVRLPAEHRDPLVVFSLAQTVLELAASLQGESRSRLQIQTPRTHATVVAHRSMLGRGLEEFMQDIAKRSVESPPVVTISEREGVVELRFLDVQLGVPVGAVRRALAAPSIPPPGLSALSSLTKAVEESHGQVRVEPDEDWGMTVVVELIRARPKVRPDPSAIAEKSLSEVIDLLKR